MALEKADTWHSEEDWEDTWPRSLSRSLSNPDGVICLRASREWILFSFFFLYTNLWWISCTGDSCHWQQTLQDSFARINKYGKLCACIIIIFFYFLFLFFQRTSVQLSSCTTQPSTMESICLPCCLVVMERHDKGTWANPFPPCHLQAFRSAAALFRLD